MSLKGVTGFYTLHHQPSGRFYIGSSGNIGMRLYTHRSDLKRGQHSNKGMTEAFKNWRDVHIVYTPTENVEVAREWERKLLEQFISHPLCCNQVIDNIEAVAGRQGLGGGRRLGSKASEETKERMRAAHAANPYSHTDELRKVISEAKMQRCSIDGSEFDSITEAMETLGIPKSTMRHRLRSNKPKYQNWFKI